MGIFFCKIFEILQNYSLGGNSFGLRIVERGKGYLQSILLGRDRAFWLLSTVDVVARLENCASFMRKLKDDAQIVFLGQCCCNTHGRYMAIEEFNGGGWRVLFLYQREEKMGLVWVCGGATASFVFVHTHEKGTPTVVLPVPILWWHPRNAPLLNWQQVTKFKLPLAVRCQRNICRVSQKCPVPEACPERLRICRAFQHPNKDKT